MTQAPHPRRTTRAKVAEAPEEEVYHAEVEEELEEPEGGRRKRKQLKERSSAASATAIETIAVCIS